MSMLRQKYAVARINEKDAGLLDHLTYIVIAVDERDAVRRARTRAKDIDALPLSRIYACPLESEIGLRLLKDEYRHVKAEGSDLGQLTFTDFRAALLGYFDDREVQYRTRKAIARKKSATKPPRTPKPVKVRDEDAEVSTFAGEAGVRVSKPADPFKVRKTHRSTRKAQGGLFGAIARRLKGA